MSESIF